MKIIEFAPLKEEAEDIQVRCSSLNSYLNPVMYTAKTLWAWMESTNLWDRIHNIVQMTMLFNQIKDQEWNWYWDTMWYIIADKHKAEVIDSKPWFRENEMKWFAEWAEQYADLVKWESCEAIETKRSCIIQFSWFQIEFSWTSDLDYSNFEQDGKKWWWMDDIKSSTGKWSQEKADEARQKYYYTWLKCISEGLEWCKFRYMILTRQKKAQKQIFEYYITKEEAEKVLYDDLKIYLTDLANQRKEIKTVDVEDIKEEFPFDEAKYLDEIWYYDE